MSQHATFVCEALAEAEAEAGHKPPPGHQGGVPRGLAMSALLRGALEPEPVEVENRWVTYEGHAFDVVHLGKRFDVTLACEDAEAGRWTLSIETRRGLMPWARKTYPKSVSLIARALHRALKTDPRVSELRWFGEDEWPPSDDPSPTGADSPS